MTPPRLPCRALSLRATVLASCLLAITGCNQNGTIEVEAVVTLDGNPLEGASVRFHPIGESATRGASGLTDSSGMARLTTFDSGDGVLPGSYLVTISKQDDAGEIDPSLQPKPPPADETEEEAEMREIREAAHAATTGALIPKYSKALPRKYRLRKETPLRCTVPPGGDVTFELSSD